jgi:hypothetical protein
MVPNSLSISSSVPWRVSRDVTAISGLAGAAILRILLWKAPSNAAQDCKNGLCRSSDLLSKRLAWQMQKRS